MDAFAFDLNNFNTLVKFSPISSSSSSTFPKMLAEEKEDEEEGMGDDVVSLSGQAIKTCHKRYLMCSFANSSLGKDAEFIFIFPFSLMIGAASVWMP